MILLNEIRQKSREYGVPVSTIERIRNTINISAMY